MYNNVIDNLNRQKQRIDEMFKDILKDNNDLEKILSAILESNKPIFINIFLGDE